MHIYKSTYTHSVQCLSPKELSTILKNKPVGGIYPKGMAVFYPWARNGVTVASKILIVFNGEESDI